MKILHISFVVLLALGLSVPAVAKSEHKHPHHSSVQKTPKSQVKTNTTKTPDAQFRADQKKSQHLQAKHKKHDKAQGLYRKANQKPHHKHAMHKHIKKPN